VRLRNLLRWRIHADDNKAGKDFSFRREWIRRRIESLASVFGIDVLTHAIISNHVHLILRNRRDVVSAWSDIEFAFRWLKVFSGRRLEEHLAEPIENDVTILVDAVVLALQSAWPPMPSE